ncbi:hypothetical protein R9C00_01410 [Flammeovirgaceae bacterium SG7u.111]|nr:hypothetical protein [Flammeovirgaceae bacterium SG7u.132]WPO36105.1 hypothetical protein R9C00_01410 [Flammeovirgaceae bacterium SG7u.111]
MLRTKLIVALLICLFGFELHTIAQDTTATAQGVYKGKIRRGVRHGYGVCTWPDGSKYEGMWKYGTMTGKGTFTYKGNTYDGLWLNGKKDGRGKLTYADGSVYEGEFKNDVKHGVGKLTLPDGSFHEGEWKFDKCNGWGKHEWATGTIYVGNWKNDEMHGSGTLVYADGRVEQGTFKNNEYLDCKCRITPTLEEQFAESTAVFVGKVVELYQSVDGKGDELIFEIEQLWKGDYGYGRRVIVKAGYTSCDAIFYEGESYLVYAYVKGTSYVTTKCTRTVPLLEATWDIEQLDNLVPCKDPSKTPPAFVGNEADHVCGCDGVTYRNTGKANKAGVYIWKKGRCEDLEE